MEESGSSCHFLKALYPLCIRCRRQFDVALQETNGFWSVSGLLDQIDVFVKVILARVFWLALPSH
jgi:hypothetical protein